MRWELKPWISVNIFFYSQSLISARYLTSNMPSEPADFSESPWIKTCPSQLRLDWLLHSPFAWPIHSFSGVFFHCESWIIEEKNEIYWSSVSACSHDGRKGHRLSLEWFFFSLVALFAISDLDVIDWRSWQDVCGGETETETVLLYCAAFTWVTCVSDVWMCVFQQQNSEGVQIPVKHQLLQIIVRVLQYRMLLTGNVVRNVFVSSRGVERLFFEFWDFSGVFYLFFLLKLGVFWYLALKICFVSAFHSFQIT